MTELRGRSLIGLREGSDRGDLFFAADPTTGERLQPGFVAASSEEVDEAARLAATAFDTYSRVPGRDKAGLLRKIAAKIESISGELIERCNQETALPQARLQGETARTCGQLRLFAQLVEEGSWAMARIDRADPERKPLPKPDVRSVLRPLGPVVVFGASNFPLAFSVAGGDTASALAAGNPVIVKAHAAHPGTSELVGRAVQDSVRECGLPQGVFSLLFGRGTQVGVALMKHPLIKAGGFTGSRTAGRILMDVAASRPHPIPFYAEMSSTNPVFILPGALRERGPVIAAGLHASFTLGAGQFCTKPGMVFAPGDGARDPFRNKLKELVEGSPEFKLLTATIQSSYRTGVGDRRNHGSVTTVAEAPPLPRDGSFSANAVLFETDVPAFLKDPHLEDEIFGPATMLVSYEEPSDLLKVAHRLEGHLTATLHGTEQDFKDAAELIAVLEAKVGRLVFNAFPTGVEVCHAMVHGGPYPSTSDGRSTSVGTQAIYRFVRAVCYQGSPNASLPDELKDENPLGIWRMVDGQMTREASIKPAAKAS